ncbi:MAG: hypothetical protein HC822_09505 [Oscillochloris sp.]|nr:hypothetical protein [Oscillochloris sp.]
MTGYYPEGPRELCLNPQACVETNYVFVAKDDRIYRYNNDSDTLSTAIYNSPDNSGLISEITGDATHLYFFERRALGCAPTCSYNSVLFRMNRLGGTASPLFNGDTSITSRPLGLVSDGTFLFWNLAGLQRLPNNAEALPVVDLEITDIEVTQGIQDLDNAVRLIEDRRTYVRVHVRSTEAGIAVPGVTARLIRVGATQFDDGLLPINTIGPALTVLPNPDRNVVNQSFLFELPWNWAEGNFTLQARLNPFQYPLEPNYSNNTRNVAISFEPSPRLEVEFVSWMYILNGTVYAPRITEDVEQTYSWIRRVYPLASAAGYADDPSPGFRPAQRSILDFGLGSRVDRSHDECQDLLIENEDGTTTDRRNLCASRYTNTQMDAMRDTYGIGLDTFMYGMISDAAGIFPRGQACCGDNVSSGPVGTPGDVMNWTWDSDSTYGDWYAGHEVGHTLGRGHPAQGNECSHSASDQNYPYAGAQIGPANGSLAGFDGGDPAFGIARQVLPATLWTDLMSYCDYQWISDYTYDGMYDRMMNGLSANLTAGTIVQPAQGDLLGVYGSIVISSGAAQIIKALRLESAADVPALVPGSHAIRLVGNGATLAEHPFTPDGIDDSDATLLGFGQIVPFAAGTTAIQIVRLSDGAIVGTQTVSANPPTVANVQLTAPGTPVSGEATLSWDADDPDGDSLSFDVFASNDGGTTLEPLVLGASGTSTVVDTSLLAGGSTIFRVVASDGINMAQADSPPVELANKAPVARILSPGDGAVFQYGQLINFSGSGFDLQDGTLVGRGLVWSNQDGVLGGDAQLAIADLPVGEHTITLRAQNSAGLSSEATITIMIEDDLTLPGPTLDVGPAQVGWHVAAGANEIQTAQLSIGNVGSGELSWTAGSDAAWLSLSASNGTAPAQLTLSADPGGMADGATRQAVVTISATSDGVNLGSVAIPVTLTAGDTWSNSEISQAPRQRLYLPMLFR